MQFTFVAALFAAVVAAAPGVVTQISDGQIQAPTGYTSVPLSTAPTVVTVTPTTLPPPVSTSPAPYPINNSTTVAPVGTGSSTVTTPSSSTPAQVSTAGAAFLGEVNGLAYFGLAAAAYFL